MEDNYITKSILLHLDDGVYLDCSEEIHISVILYLFKYGSTSNK